MTPEEQPTRPDDGDSARADLQEALRRLGAESETERAVRRIVPWIVSFAVHAGLLVAGLLVTWTIANLRDERPPARIVADFDALAYDPVPRLEAEAAETPLEALQDRLPEETFAERDDSVEADLDALRLLSNAAASSALARFAPTPQAATAVFVGLRTSNARRIVYVIDASGSMIRSLPIVVDELARSLDGLTAEQEFGVVFFQRNEALVVPPADRLRPAGSKETARVLAWIDEKVIPAGRSNPIAALRVALALRPDVVFLLSENITGSGEYEIDQRDLLALLDELNPADAATGRRPVRINCVQFLDPDPLGTLRLIAEAHGGADGYKLLDRAELGLGLP